MVELYTQSSITMWQRCQQEYQYAYRQGIRPARESKALTMGSAYHHALELFFSKANSVETLSVVNEYDMDWIDAEKIKMMVSLYTASYSGDDYWQYGDVRCEEVFQFDLPNGRTMGGKFDALIPTYAGVKIMEHKTTSQDIGAGAPYWSALLLDWQVTVYEMAARELGLDPECVIYDVARKPAHRLGKKDTKESFRKRVFDDMSEHPDKYLRREEVHRLEHERAKNTEQLVLITDQIANTTRPVKNPKSCTRYGSRCAYFDVCAGVGDIKDGDMFRLVSPHEELRA